MRKWENVTGRGSSSSEYPMKACDVLYSMEKLQTSYLKTELKLNF